MTPFRFGHAARQLFGLHIPASALAPRSHGVLLCNPFGQEAIRCHRLYRVLGERLAREGYHVLRFDFFATGDSDGDDLEGDLEAWIGDVGKADEELRQRAGCERSSWFGLRFGASLAALASGRAAAPPEQLVLWDPVLDGALYVDELSRSHAAEMRAARASMASAPAPVERPAGAPLELLGYPLGERLLAGLRGLSAASFSGMRAASVAVLESAAPEGARSGASRLAEAGVGVRAIALDTRISWASDEAMNTAIVPAEALQAIVCALGAPR